MFRFSLTILFSLILFTQVNFAQVDCIDITTQPQNVTIVINKGIILTNNTSITLNTIATSSENLNYQWQRFDIDTNDWVDIKNNDEFSGVTTNTLTISNVNSLSNLDRFKVIIYTNNSSCSQEESQEATIRKVNININNFFSPNGDGINETFNTSGLNNELFKGNEIEIYNRWGNLVYKAKDYQNNWNGVSNTGFSIRGSKIVPTGTYFYSINLNYKGLKISGWLQIVR